MRSAIHAACTLSGVRAFVVDLGDDSCMGGEEAVGSDGGEAVCVWFRRFWSLKGFSKPPIARPIHDKFLGISVSRVRRLELSDAQRRVFVSRGADFRATLKVYREADLHVVVQMRDGDAAVDSRLGKNQRLSQLLPTRGLIFYDGS